MNNFSPISDVRVSLRRPTLSTRKTPTKVKMKLIDATNAANHAAADMEATPENLMTEAAMSMGNYKL